MEDAMEIESPDKRSMNGDVELINGIGIINKRDKRITNVYTKLAVAKKLFCNRSLNLRMTIKRK
jgi:hypothetical protein